MRWQIPALGAAFFTGLTAIFGKLGVAEIHSDPTTDLRTGIVWGFIARIVTARRPSAWR